MRDFFRFLKFLGEFGVSRSFRLARWYFYQRFNLWPKYRQNIQRAEASSDLTQAPEQDLISILIPVFNTNLIAFKKCIQSICAQTYKNWEMILIDDGSTNKEFLNVLRDVPNQDKRIRVLSNFKNLGISAATNLGLQNAKGSIVVFVDHDDSLEKDSLYEVERAFQKNSKIQMVYSDHDRITEDDVRFDPVIKGEFDMEWVESFNFACHLLAVKAELAKSVGMLRSDFDFAQDHDFVLRLIQKISSSEISYIPKILYHWRAVQGSTASGPQKNGTIDAHPTAINSHFQNTNRKVSVGCHPIFTLYRTDYEAIAASKIHRVHDIEQCRNLPPNDIVIFSNVSIPLDQSIIHELASNAGRGEVCAISPTVLTKSKMVKYAGVVSTDEIATGVEGKPFYQIEFDLMRVHRRITKKLSPDIWASKVNIVLESDCTFEKIAETAQKKNLRLIWTPYSVVTLKKS